MRKTEKNRFGLSREESKDQSEIGRCRHIDKNVDVVIYERKY